MLNHKIINKSEDYKYIRKLEYIFKNKPIIFNK